MTGSVKTRHNCASLNLQYKALNAMGEIHVLAYKILKLLNALLVGANSKKLGITVYAYSRGVQKALFCCSRQIIPSLRCSKHTIINTSDSCDYTCKMPSTNMARKSTKINQNIYIKTHDSVSCSPRSRHATPWVY